MWWIAPSFDLLNMNANEFLKLHNTPGPPKKDVRMAMDRFLATEKRVFERSIVNLTKAEIGILRQLRRKYVRIKNISNAWNLKPR